MTFRRPSSLPFGWVVPTVRYPEKKMAQTHGLDAVMFVKFVRTALWIVALQTLFGVLILIPINATASNKDLPDSDPVGYLVFSVAYLLLLG